MLQIEALVKFFDTPSCQYRCTCQTLIAKTAALGKRAGTSIDRQPAQSEEARPRGGRRILHCGPKYREKKTQLG